MVRTDLNIKSIRENLSKTEETSEFQRLLESEEKYRTLFETMVLGVVYRMLMVRLSQQILRLKKYSVYP